MFNALKSISLISISITAISFNILISNISYIVEVVEVINICMITGTSNHTPGVEVISGIEDIEGIGKT